MHFLFTESNGKLLFLVCQETIAVLKKHNLKRHYQSRHKVKYKTIIGQERENKIERIDEIGAPATNRYRKTRRD